MIANGLIDEWAFDAEVATVLARVTARLESAWRPQVVFTADDLGSHDATRQEVIRRLKRAGHAVKATAGGGCLVVIT
jgi:hypothetical protein